MLRPTVIRVLLPLLPRSSYLWHTPCGPSASSISSSSIQSPQQVHNV